MSFKEELAKLNEKYGKVDAKADSWISEYLPGWPWLQKVVASKWTLFILAGIVGGVMYVYFK